jgi:hypothetical protein
MAYNPYEGLDDYLQQPPEPRFDRNNLPPPTEEEKLEANRQWQQYLLDADLPNIILIINDKKIIFSDVESKKRSSQVNSGML